MATAAQLKKLRKKHGLGEFSKKKKKSTRRRPWKARHKAYHKRFAPKRKRKKSSGSRTLSYFHPGGTFPSNSQLGPSFPGSPFNQFTDSMPATNTASQRANPLPSDVQTPGDVLLRVHPENPAWGIFQTNTGHVYKKLLNS